MKRFLTIFKVPGVARDIVDRIVSKEEIELLEAVGSGSFTVRDASEALKKAGKEMSADKLNRLLRSAYRRGVIQLEDESFTKFRTGSFYGRLDVFATTENEAYRSLPPDIRKALDRWYFNAYLESLGEEPRPTVDRILTLKEALEKIDQADRQIWLNQCDCRSLTGDCGKPLGTCLTLRSGINTLAHRGWSRPLTKEQAKQVVRMANRAGLVQTANLNGMCNCCGDCCYLFRAQRARHSEGVWPRTDFIASFRKSRCIACGRCVKRCNFGAFTMGKDGISYDPGLCRGCGLCVETCPKAAITLKRRIQDGNGG